MVGLLYQQFAITIAVSVLLSAFIALTLTPALCSIMLKPSELNAKSTGMNKVFYRFNNWFARVTKRYSSGVRVAIKRAPIVIIILVCLYVGTYGLFSAKPAGFITTEDNGIFITGITLTEGSSASRTTEVLQEMEATFMEAFPEINNITAINGINLLNRSFTSNGK